MDFGQNIITGTPNLVFDLIRSKRLSTFDVLLLVLDQADQMIKIGFKDIIFDVYRHLPSSAKGVY